MEISKSRAAAYLGAGAAIGGGFAALSGSGTMIVLGAATGIVAGTVQTAVETATGAGELGWGASIATGAVAGAFLLKGLASAALTPIAQRGVGAAIGATAGMLAPVAAGMVLAQFSPDA